MASMISACSTDGHEPLIPDLLQQVGVLEPVEAGAFPCRQWA